MSSFSYSRVEDQYGEKLAISFNYDEEIVSRIKLLDWETTHRSWNPDHEAWLIDWNDESVSQFESVMGVTVPGEYRPDEGFAGKIDIVVPDGYTWFFIQNSTIEIDRLLSEEFSYFQPGAEYTDRYKSGSWDGYVRLYNSNNHGAAVGLLDRAVSLIEDLGYDVEVTIEGDRSGDDIETEWLFEHDLRQYQRLAVGQAIENEGGVVSFPTGAGKTVVGLRLVYNIGQRAIVFVHTKELLYQWASEVREILGVEPGLIGDGQWSEGPVTIAIMQTLMSRGTDDLADYGVEIFDECHRTSAAETMHEIGMDIDCEWRFGLSATPWRSVQGEELKIEGAVGGIASQVTAEQMIDEGFLARPEFEIIEPQSFGTQATPNPEEEFHDLYRRCVEMDPTRNEAVASKAAELVDRGYKVMVNVDRVKQGRLLEYALSSIDIEEAIGRTGRRLEDERDELMFRSAAATIKIGDYDAVFLSGSDDTETRQAVLEEFENGDIDLLISTLLKEGVDIPNISAIVLAEGLKSDIAKIQTLGRALRPSNGDHAIIADVRDRGRKLGDHFATRQHTFTEYYGDYGPGMDEVSGTPDTGSEPPERQSLTEEMTPEEQDLLLADMGFIDEEDVGTPID